MSEDCHDSGFCPTCGGNGETGHDPSCPEIKHWDFSDWFEHVYVKTDSLALEDKAKKASEDWLANLSQEEFVKWAGPAVCPDCAIADNELIGTARLEVEELERLWISNSNEK